MINDTSISKIFEAGLFTLFKYCTIHAYNLPQSWRVQIQYWIDYKINIALSHIVISLVGTWLIVDVGIFICQTRNRGLHFV